jgi:hypothetical protein
LYFRISKYHVNTFYTMNHSNRLPLSSTVIFCILILSLLGIKGHSEHITGGEISYEYIGDSTNINHQYRITIKYVRTNFNTTFLPPQTITMCRASVCFPTSQHTLTLKSITPEGDSIPDNFQCLDGSDSLSFQFFSHIYEGIITLPGACYENFFRHVVQCCRIPNGQVVNYGNDLYGGIYLGAFLNNAIQEKTLTFKERNTGYGFCHNQNVSISHTANIESGDSVTYNLAQIRNNSSSCNIGTLISFTPGYSVLMPFNMSPNSFLNFTQDGRLEYKTGNLSGGYAYAVEVKAYTLHPGGNFFYHSGTIYKDETIIVGANCKPDVIIGPILKPQGVAFPNIQYPTSVLSIIDTGISIPNIDSVPAPNSPTGFGLPWKTYYYSCPDTLLPILFIDKISCASISDDLSEFTITAFNSDVLTAINYSANCNDQGLADTLYLVLDKPLPYNGNYFVSIRMGSDGNTIMNSCGFNIPEDYTFAIQANNCPNLTTNTLVTGNPKIYIHPNPTSKELNISHPYFKNEKLNVEIASILGATIYTGNISAIDGKASIDVSHLADGAYFINIKTSSAAYFSEKFIVKAF